MARFRLIGFWSGEEADGWPDVHDFVDPSDDGRDAILARLSGGLPTDIVYLGFSWCRFCGCENGCGELTDGVLIWHEGLAHYVREHKVRLPPAVEALLLAASAADEATVQAAVMAWHGECDAKWWRTISTVP